MTDPPSVILRPKSRAEIYLPWRGNPRANFEWLRCVCGDRTRPEYDRQSKRFYVARGHIQHIIQALVEEYGSVKVTQYGYRSTTCVQQCWNANPNSYLQCECGCAGRNHGSGVPMGHEVQSGLSVEYDLSVWEYQISRDGVVY